MNGRTQTRRTQAVAYLMLSWLGFGSISWAQVDDISPEQSTIENTATEPGEADEGEVEQAGAEQPEVEETHAPDSPQQPATEQIPNDIDTTSLSTSGDVQQQAEEAKENTINPSVLDKVTKFIDTLKFETLWYLHYRYGRAPSDSGNLADGYENYNLFNIGRGYLTVKMIPTDWFESRITLDAHQDETGDMKVRLKYLYGKLIIPIENLVVTEPFVEFGLVHMPWLDYEEHINWYRAQGTMFMERNKLFNSADFGITLGMLLGKKLDERYQQEVNNKYPGTLGSLAVGLYNGGGYHALEANSNKVFEARVSLRPLGPIFPNLQLSYFAVVGRGNLESTDEWDPPKWQSHTLMASFEHRYLVLTGQFLNGKGNQKGSFVDWTSMIDQITGEEIVTGIDDVHEYKGASGFMEIKLPSITSSLLGRYDWFDKQDKDDLQLHRIIVGLAYHFYKLHKNFVMLDLDYIIPDEVIDDAEPFFEIKLTLQISL